MKLALRRPVEVPDPVEGAPAAPRPPRGRPVVAFAGILDGRSLWVAIHAAPGALALRAVESGDVVALASDVPDDDPAFRSVRVDLRELPGGAEAASYDVVLVPAGGGTATPVWSHPLPAETVVRTPVSADGSHAWSLERRDDGGLRAVRVPRSPTALLRSVAQEGETFSLTVEVPGEPGAGHELSLVADDGTVVHALAMTRASDGLGRADIVLADLPAGDDVWTRVLVDGLEVRRRGDDLVQAQASTLMPQVFGEDRSRPRLRLRWTTDGLLVLRIGARGAGTSGPGATEDGTS